MDLGYLRVFITRFKRKHELAKSACLRNIYPPMVRLLLSIHMYSLDASLSAIARALSIRTVQSTYTLVLYLRTDFALPLSQLL